MPRKVIILLAVLLLSGAGLSFTDPEQKEREEKALLSTQSWLKLVDDEEYLASWKESGVLLREHITDKQWIAIMYSRRKPFGAIVTRKQKDAEYKTDLPGAPKGEYMIIRFETVFENRKGIIAETATVALDEKDVWRVIGYFIQ